MADLHQRLRDVLGCTVLTTPRFEALVALCEEIRREERERAIQIYLAPCGTCAGKAIGNGACICGGVGTLAAEAQGMREELLRRRCEEPEPAYEAEIRRSERALTMCDMALYCQDRPHNNGAFFAGELREWAAVIDPKVPAPGYWTAEPPEEEGKQ